MAAPSNQGASLPSNYIWDIQEIQQVNVDPRLKELLIRLYQNLNIMALTINMKDTAIYQLIEVMNGQSYFPNPLNNSTTPVAASNRTVFRKTFLINNMGASATILHNITVTSLTTFTRIYGVANDTSGNNYYPIPWASAAGATNIEIKVNATQIVITNNSTITFSTVYVVLEYIQT
jgi:hypothetical protein